MFDLSNLCCNNKTTEELMTLIHALDILKQISTIEKEIAKWEESLDDETKKIALDHLKECIRSKSKQAS
jgi:hypothetical protein